MDGFSPLPCIETLKNQAKRLRASLELGGTAIGHGKALELLAHQHGYTDWNTLYAAAGNQPPSSPVAVGARVRGYYLNQAFEADVIGIKALSPPGRFRVTLHFDEAVDVVTFDSFSSFRRRVTCTIDRTGISPEKTSDGRPHLQLRL